MHGASPAFTAAVSTDTRCLKRAGRERERPPGGGRSCVSSQRDQLAGAVVVSSAAGTSAGTGAGAGVAPLITASTDAVVIG